MASSLPLETAVRHVLLATLKEGYTKCPARDRVVGVSAARPSRCRRRLVAQVVTQVGPAAAVEPRYRTIRAAHAPAPRSLCWDCSSGRCQHGALPPLPGLVRVPGRQECTGEVPGACASSVMTHGRQ